MARSKVPQVCSVPDCDAPGFARTWCRTHYARWSRLGTTHIQQRTRQLCSLDDCDRPLASHGYCGMHWHRMREHGDPRHITIRKKLKAACSIADCSGVAVARGMCPKHWNRWKKNGSPEAVQVIIGEPEMRFWSKVRKTDGCWLWAGRTFSNGYGQMKVNKETVYAHRYSFFLHNRYWPEPMCLHSCDNPPCVNPAHLREGTAEDNARDRDVRGRGRYSKGTKDAV